MRSASPRCGNATMTRVPAADERAQLVLGLGEAAGGDRGPLRLERERLAGRERVELGRASSGTGSSPPPPRPCAPRPAARRGPGRRSSGATRSVGSGGGSSSVVGESRLDEIEAPLGGRDRSVAALDRVQRALREGREGADLSISSPKNSIRSGSRPVVGKTSTMPPRTRELAALLDAVRPARSRRARAARRARRCRARRRRASSSGSGRARGGGMPSASAAAEAQTSPPAREHVERAGPLADEVGRRLEPRAPAHTAARKQRDALVPRNQPAASAASRASASSGVSTTRGRAELLVESPPARAGARARRRGRASPGAPRGTRGSARCRRARERTGAGRAGP